MPPGEPIPQNEPQEEVPVFNVFKPDKIESFVDFFSKRVADWHDNVKPNVIFLDDASAVFYGFVFKEAWRNAYPDEVVPKFMRFDPGLLMDRESKEIDVDVTSREHAKKTLSRPNPLNREFKEDAFDSSLDKIKNIQERENITTLVYDETPRGIIDPSAKHGERRLERAVQLVGDGSFTDTRIAARSQNVTVKTLKKLGFRNIWVDNGPSDAPALKDSFSHRMVDKHSYHFAPRGSAQMTTEQVDEERRRILSNNLLIMEDIKKIGGFIAQNMAKQTNQQ